MTKIREPILLCNCIENGQNVSHIDTNGKCFYNTSRTSSSPQNILRRFQAMDVCTSVEHQQP